MVKSNLREVLEDLKEWASIFDVSWYCLINLSNKHVDQALSSVSHSDSDPLFNLKTLREAIKSNISSEPSTLSNTIFIQLDQFSRRREGLGNSEAQVWNC